jgi:hypothetical protein
MKKYVSALAALGAALSLAAFVPLANAHPGGGGGGMGGGGGRSMGGGGMGGGGGGGRSIGGGHSAGFASSMSRSGPSGHVGSNFGRSGHVAGNYGGHGDHGVHGHHGHFRGGVFVYGYGPDYYDDSYDNDDYYDSDRCYYRYHRRICRY